MKAGSWLSSRSEQEWSGFVDEHATKEEAIAAAPTDLDLEPGDPFWVGEVQEVGAYFDADDALERLAERLYEQCGDAAVGYCPLPSSEAKAEFNQILNVWHVWLRKHGLHPEGSCFWVERVEQFVAPNPEEP